MSDMKWTFVSWDESARVSMCPCLHHSKCVFASHILQMGSSLIFNLGLLAQSPDIVTQRKVSHLPCVRSFIINKNTSLCLARLQGLELAWWWCWCYFCSLIQLVGLCQSNVIGKTDALGLRQPIQALESDWVNGKLSSNAAVAKLLALSFRLIIDALVFIKCLAHSKAGSDRSVSSMLG